MSAPPAVRRTRSLKECADEIGVSYAQVRTWIHAGDLPAKWCGNRYLVLDTALQKFIDAFGDAHDGVD